MVLNLLWRGKIWNRLKKSGMNESTETQSQIQSVQFSRLTSMGTDGIKGEGRRNLDLILGYFGAWISVELGHTNMLIKDILALSQGSIVELDKVGWNTCRSVRSGETASPGGKLWLWMKILEEITNICGSEELVKNLG